MPVFPSPAAGPVFPVSTIPAVNVSRVPQRSPLRYPGGKTWLIPHIRAWLASRTDTLVEPFAGGGIVSLTSVMENLAERAIMVELDPDVAAFWYTVLKNPEGLISRIQAFTPSRTSIAQLMRGKSATVEEHGFRTLVLNRTRRGGVLAPGASLTKRGENGAGITSRWYPDTLVRRIRDIARHAERIKFYEGDGMDVLQETCHRSDAVLFIDPPYTAGGKRAGSRLYRHHTVDHGRIFKTLALSEVDFLMTYDCAPEIIVLVKEYGFQAVIVEMKSGHHRRLPELVITRTCQFA